MRTFYTSLLLISLFPLPSLSLSCFSCYSFNTNSSSFSDYLPPLLLDLSPDTCLYGNTITCPAASTCMFSSLQLIYGDETAQITTMGCAGVKQFLTCSELEKSFKHPLFDIDECHINRCQFDRCNGGDIQMLSGANSLVSMTTTVTLNLLFYIL